MLPVIYAEFKKHLLQKQMCYEGMAYRHVIEQLKNDSIELKWRKIIFAGFYALSRAHDELISELQKKNKVILYWDGDAYYLDDATQEAGNYFRKKKLLKPDFLWKGNYFGTEEKEIIMTGVPLHVGQAKYLGDVIGKQLEEGKFTENKTAVVLPDENLLFPVLYSLPEELKSFNVTMGYPLKKSLLSGFIQLLTILQKNIRENKNGMIYFSSKAAIALLEHPYNHYLKENGTDEKIFEIKKYNKTYCTAKDFLADDDENLLFRKLNSPDDVFNYVNLILKSCIEKDHTKNPLSKPDTEIILFAIHEINALHEIVRANINDMDATMAWQLIRKVTDKLKIPFSGEPVMGLQIMGFLETRALDFENLFILSANENILPSVIKGGSFIPYSIRKGAGLPTPEDHDAMQAYNFYRLLQRAKTIHLIYDTEVKSLTGGEKSRFLLQISYEMKKRLGDKIKLRHELLTTEVKAEKIKPVFIEKNNALVEDMQKRFTKNQEGVKGFSASALSTYIGCKLQFYFRHIAGIKEQEEIEEKIEADVFGKILHGTMQKLYGTGGEITAGRIEKLLPLAESMVSESFYKEFPYDSGEPEGRNYLNLKVIVQLVKNILEADKGIAPFNIDELEKTFHMPFIYNDTKKEVMLKGVFDRVDSVNGYVRIVDYKTGKDKLKSEKGFEEIFVDPKLKATFQLYFYSYIYHSIHPDKKLKAGIYRMKNMSEGISYLNNGEEIGEAELQEFEKHLKKLISEIMNPEIAFSQTEDVNHCRYCPYKEICNR